MSKRVLKHVRSNAIGYLALFFALSGAAYAANTVRSIDIVDGEVKTADIGAGAVTVSDIGANAVTSAKILDGTVTSADVANETLTGADIKNGTVGGADVAANALDGTDIVEGSLDLGLHFSAAVASGSCTDDSHTGAVCGSTTINLERPGRLLVNASGNWRTVSLNDVTDPGANTDDSTAVAGRCVLRVDGNSISLPTNMGEDNAANPTVPVHGVGFEGTFGLTELSDTLNSGNHTVDVFCIEADGDLDWVCFTRWNQSRPTCVSSQAVSGASARHSLAISAVAFGLTSHAGQPTSFEAVSDLYRNRSARG